MKISSKVVNLNRWKVEPRSIMPLAAVLELEESSGDKAARLQPYWQEVLSELVSLGVHKCIIKPAFASSYAANVACTCADKGLAASLLLGRRAIEEGDMDIISSVQARRIEIVFDIDVSQAGWLAVLVPSLKALASWSIRLGCESEISKSMRDDILRLVHERPTTLSLSGAMPGTKLFHDDTLIDIMSACKETGTQTNIPDYYGYFSLIETGNAMSGRCFVPWWLIVIDDDGMVRNCLGKGSPRTRWKPGKLKDIWNGSALDRFRSDSEKMLHRDSCACGLDLEMENMFLERMHDGR
jgi:hypothetical protein